MNTPSAAKGMLWPLITLGRPFLSNLPIRGPSIIVPTSAATPPTPWTTVEPAKS